MNIEGPNPSDANGRTRLEIKAAPSGDDGKRAIGKTVASQRFDELASLCRDVDRDMGRPAGHGADALEPRILAKLAVYAIWAERHRYTLRETRNGTLCQATVMKHIRHAGAPRTAKVQAALSALSEKFLDTMPTRHDPETPIDRKLDAYERMLETRNYGPPRQKTNPDYPAHKASAAEIPCDVAELDCIALRRLVLMMRAMPAGMLSNARARDAGRPENPAVKPLVMAGLASFADGLPEDPLFPGRVDYITLADRSGVAVDDILEDEELRTAVHLATVATKPIRSPFLAIRRYTWGDLIDWGRDAATHEQSAGQARKAVHALRGLMEIEGRVVNETDQVPYNLPDLVERAIAADYRNFDAGWRGWMKKWIAWNDALRASKPLPTSLALKLRILLMEAGLGVRELATELADLPGAITGWVDGRAIPTVAAEAKLAALAERLRTPLAVIKRDLRDEFRVRAFGLEALGYKGKDGKRLPFDFETRFSEDERRAKLKANEWLYDKQDLAYSRRLPSLARAQYKLKHGDWPAATQKAWSDNWPNADKRGGLRAIGDQGRRERTADGKLKKAPKKIRVTTIRLKRDQLEYVLGFLHSPRQPVVTASANPSPDDYVAEGGLGIPRHLIKVALLALPDLVTAFTGYRARRAGSTNRAVTMALKAIVVLLKPELGIVWRSPNMIEDLREFAAWWRENPMAAADEDFFFDIQAFEDNWEGAVAHTHALIRDDIEAIAQEHADDEEFEPSRNAFDAVRVYIDHDKPMAHYMKSVRALLGARPTSIVERHVHTRDCVQTLILCQTGLRTYNMLFTYDAGDGGPERRKRGRNGQILEPTIRKLEKDGETKWVIKIPSSEFKNFYSPYFKGRRPYEHVLADEDGLYALLEEYTTKSRFYLLRGVKSDALFVTAAGKDMNESYAGANYRRVTATYFIHNPDLGVGGVEGAMPHAMHSVRNVRATHIVKVTGDLHLAAWSIQDQVRTVERHYAEFIPKDKVKLADEVLALARAAGRVAAPV